MFVTGQVRFLWGKCSIWGPWRICKGESKFGQMFSSGVKKKEVHCGAEVSSREPECEQRTPRKGEEGEEEPSQNTIHHRTGSREARKGS